MNVWNKFRLDGKTAVITGGAGLLAKEHATALLDAGARCILVDIDTAGMEYNIESLSDPSTAGRVLARRMDVMNRQSIIDAYQDISSQFGPIDILINNAAVNPKITNEGATQEFSRLENFPLHQWELELNVGLTGAFLCCQVFGSEMAKRKQGVILNVASDLAVIAPDQRIYRQEGLKDEQQPVKPVTYSVVKTGLIGLTRYLATYWAEYNVRVNAISPGGVYNGQPDNFVRKVSSLIPMGRMANKDEYQAAVLFLVSDASSYMTGNNLIIDGGRTVW